MLKRRVLSAVCAIVALTTGGVGFAAGPTAPAAPTTLQLDSYVPIQVADGAPGTQSLTAAPVSTATIAPTALAKAQAYSDSMGGHALLVWQGGKLRYEHYGVGVDLDTRFETFSMHKSILGLLYGAALRDGVIGSLDDKVGDYLIEWRNDPRGGITLRQLLTMETGLSLIRGDSRAEIALAAAQDLPPGSRFEYNNVNPEIAGIVLDRALKKAGKGDYAAYLSHALLKPLGAGDAHLWIDHAGGEPRFYAFCQMRASDWLRVGIMIDRKGRFGGAQVIPAAWIGTMTTPSLLNPNYGILTWIGSPWTAKRVYGPRTPMKVIHSSPYLAPDLVFFDGFGGQRVYVAPSLDLVIARTGEPSAAFDDSLIPNTIIHGLQPRHGD